MLKLVAAITWIRSEYLCHLHRFLSLSLSRLYVRRCLWDMIAGCLKLNATFWSYSLMLIFDAIKTNDWICKICYEIGIQAAFYARQSGIHNNFEWDNMRSSHSTQNSQRFRFPALNLKHKNTLLFKWVNLMEKWIAHLSIDRSPLRTVPLFFVQQKEKKKKWKFCVTQFTVSFRRSNWIKINYRNGINRQKTFSPCTFHRIAAEIIARLEMFYWMYAHARST